jgi:hypothetical protein
MAECGPVGSVSAYWPDKGVSLDYKLNAIDSTVRDDQRDDLPDASSWQLAYELVDHGPPAPDEKVIFTEKGP